MGRESSNSNPRVKVKAKAKLPSNLNLLDGETASGKASGRKYVAGR